MSNCFYHEYLDLLTLETDIIATRAGAVVLGRSPFYPGGGVQMAADGAARIDFDLPDPDNDRLRGPEPTINDAIRQDLPVRHYHVGLDRQACGGSHLASTGRSGAVRILKIDNKGRHNRRVRIGLADAPSQLLQR